MKYKLHHLCTLFPRIEDDQFKQLVEDIKANGLTTPITLHEGKILDGQNRYAACLEAGVEPRFEELGEADPKKYVASANLLRRHLDDSQRAMIAAKLCGKDMTVEEASEAMSASKRSTERAKRVDVNSKNLAKQVLDGKISLTRAEKIIDEKSADRRTPVTKPNKINGYESPKNAEDSEISKLKKVGFSDAVIRELSTFMDSAASIYTSRNGHLDIPELKTELVKIVMKYHDPDGPKEPVTERPKTPVITDDAIAESENLVREYVVWWRNEVKCQRKVTFEQIEQWMIELLRSLPTTPPATSLPATSAAPRSDVLERLEQAVQDAPDDVAIWIQDFIANMEGVNV